MHEGQKQFFDYILRNAAPENIEEAKNLLNDCFEKQSAGTFTAKFLAEVTPKILATLKPEHYAEVKEVMDNFGGQHIS